MSYSVVASLSLRQGLTISTWLAQKTLLSRIPLKCAEIKGTSYQAQPRLHELLLVIEQNKGKIQPTY